MRKAFASVLFSAAVAASLGACVHHGSYVKVDDVALGRVVVYRNGVAYYERRAEVTGGKLQVRVPRDRVDDFLKSLTVVDARTHKPVPVSFPRQANDGSGTVAMTLALPSNAPADLVLTYVTEAPAWKPSYRVVVGKDDKVMLEGWAIVDNTSGEDWKDVLVGVGSSSALSFHFDLWSVRQVARATLHANESFAVAPPVGQSPYGGGPTTAPAQVAVLDDDEIRRPPGHPDAPRPAPPRAEIEKDSVDGAGDYGGATGTLSTGSYGGAGGGGGRSQTMSVSRHTSHHRPARERTAAATPPPPPTRPTVSQNRVAQGDQKLDQLARQLTSTGQTLVVQGYANANQPGAEQRARDRANLVRNQLIDRGVPPAQVRIEAKATPGQPDQVRLVAEPTPVGEHAGAQGQAKADETDEAPVGESLFQSGRPMTIGKGSSVMVSMVQKETEGEVVYLYDAESERGNQRYAFKAVRLKNPTDSTLETGPVTVYGQNRFIGEGLTDPIPPKASVVVPFALDRQIIVDEDDSQANEVSRLVTLERGILTAEVQHIKRTKLTFTSRLRTPTKLFIRHTTTKGWTLIDAPKAFEKIGDAHLFEIDLGPGQARSVQIAEATPMTRTLDLSQDVSLDMLKVWVQAPEGNPELKQQLKDLLATHRTMADLQEEIDSLHQRLGDFRERENELHAQILTLQAVKTGGDLMVHLKKKMKEISDKVQKATIDVVDAEEKLMLTRIKFQDSLAELHLPDAIPGAPGPGTPPAASGPAASK
jgi:hypothetical protein